MFESRKALKKRIEQLEAVLNICPPQATKIRIEYGGCGSAVTYDLTTMTMENTGSHSCLKTKQ